MLEVGFILSASRSGSTWLNLVLGSHSWSSCLGEYWRPFHIPGFLVCNLCDANGLAECTSLHGIEKVARSEAFHFAAARMRKPVLIDASKRVAWATEFVDRDDIDARLIHLIRHPCGFAESFGRRYVDLSVEQIFDHWEQTNRAITDFIGRVDKPSIMVCYDDLADDPQRYFPPLCSFLGYQWESTSLRFWETAHHGPGGGGASSFFLRGRRRTNYRTGDDAFYEEIKDRPLSADRRWKTRLPTEMCRTLIEQPYARELARVLGKESWEL
jgi:hypothetical protein